MNKEIKKFSFEIKQVDEDGTFEGYLSKYDVVDLGKDVVKKGAFTKTIQESGGEVPLLWQHDHTSPIGSLKLEDRDEGLWVKGKLALEVQKAKEAYELVKAGVIKGLSIGYQTMREKMDGSIRNLLEISLKEGSIVTFPMLPLARIESVKAEFTADEWAFAQKLVRLFGPEDAVSTSRDAGDTSLSDAVSTSKDAGDTSEDANISWLKGLRELLEEI